VSFVVKKTFGKPVLPVLMLLLTPVVCFMGYKRLRVEMEWCEIAHRSLAGQTEEMLPEYQTLHNKLSNNHLFLYNYAAEFNFSGHYEESNTIARACERLWADYDLQMLLADNCQKLQDYTAAEQHYRKAAAMCPVKFMPLYQLAKIYDATGRKDEAVALAEQIVNKPIKIVSSTIIAIQREMRQLIEEAKNNAPATESRTSSNPQKHSTRQGETPDIQPSGNALPP